MLNVNICLSTFGVPSKIKELSYIDYFSGDLFISLHSPFNEERKALLPLSAKFPIEKVLEAGRFYVQRKRRKIHLNYLLLDNVNNKLRHAKALASLIDPNYFTIKILLYNEDNKHKDERRGYLRG